MQRLTITLNFYGLFTIDFVGDDLESISSFSPIIKELAASDGVNKYQGI